MHFAPDRSWEKEGSRKNGLQMMGFLDMSAVIEMFNEGASALCVVSDNGRCFLSCLFSRAMRGWPSFGVLAAFEQFNVSHTVNRLHFGPWIPPLVRRSLNLTSQLDGATRSVADGYGMFQYYLQVVPTVYRFLNGTTVETYQYSVTEHTRHVDPGSNRGLPGVFFFYEVSALHVEFEEYRRGWTHFFTGVCAAVGGAFTVMGMLDRSLFEWRDGRGRALVT